MKILLVYPEFPDTFWSFKHALEFINKKISNPPLGLMTIASLLPNDWQKKLIDTNIHSLTDVDIRWADFVFVSAMDVQRRSCQNIIHRVKSLGGKVVAGGPLFTEEYHNFTEVDHFILNEGELTLPSFIEDVRSGKLPKKVYTSTEYADIQLSPAPDLSMINIFDYDCMSIQFSRGCPYQCDFCNVTALLGHKPRMKSVAQIITELNNYYLAGWRRNVFFVDDNFIGNKKYLKEEVLPALKEWRKDKNGFTFLTEASINLADDDDLLTLMRQAGFTSVFIGIETPNESSLVECKKSQNTKRDLIASIKKIHQAGIQVMAGFIVGFDNDTPDIFERMINFIQESGIVTAMVGLLQAPNKTALYSRLQAEGRILNSMSGDNADGSTNIVPKMDPVILKNGYKRIINTIYSPAYLYPRIQTLLADLKTGKNPGGVYASEVKAFIKTICRMGMRKGEARHYWNLVLWTLSHCPVNFPLAITLSIYGYHFRATNAINQKNELQAAKRLSSNRKIGQTSIEAQVTHLGH